MQERYYPISTNHPEIASLVRAHDQWVHELVSRSVLATPVTSGLDMACGSAEASVTLTRQPSGYGTGVATWSQPPSSPCSAMSDDPISDAEPLTAPVRTAADDAIRGPLRALAKRPENYKYGFCADHQRAFKLHLVKTGPNAGRFWCRCELFWHRGSDGRPQCWRGQAYRGPVEALPKSAVRAQERMRRDLRFQLQHGPQTRAM